MRIRSDWFVVLAMLLSTTAWAGIEIKPEKTTQIVLSNTDVNRVVCRDGKVSDVFFSEEKGVVVSTAGENVFVKTKMKRNLSTGEIIRPVLNIDLHVVCAGQVYSIIGALKPVPAQTVYLTDGMGQVRKNLALLGAMPVEKRIRSILLSAYRNEYPESFTVRAMNEAFANMDGNIIDRVRVIRIEGLGLRVTEYQYHASKAVRLQERDFLQPAFGQHIAAVSIDSDNGQLSAGQTARVFVMERVHE